MSADVAVRQPKGIPSGGQFAADARAEPGLSLTATPDSAAEILGSAVGTDRDPRTIDWPELPATDGYVEVDVWDDDVNAVLGRSGYDGDEADAFVSVYAGIRLAADKDCDFYGVTRDGCTEIIAQGIVDYEQAVDPFNHESLRYRDGYANPMPPYLAARKETDRRRLEASEALLEDTGVRVELEDLERGRFRLRREGAKDLRLELRNAYDSRLIETANWREATDEHHAAFLHGEVPGESSKLLGFAATLVARDLSDKAYREKYGRK